MSAVKKLASHLAFTKDMKLFYNNVELYQTSVQKWHGGMAKQDTKPETLHGRTLHRQRLGIMQSEQEKYKLWTHIFELMFDPQSLKVTNIHFFVINGS